MLAKRTRITVMVIVVLATCSGVVTLVFFRINRRFAPTTFNSLRVVAEYTNLALPESAVLLDGEYQEGLSRYLIAKIRIARVDLQSFLSQPPLREREPSDRPEINEYNSPQMKRRGWKISRIQHLIAIDAVGVQHRGYSGGLWTIIDLDDPHTAVVYLYYQD